MSEAVFAERNRPLWGLVTTIRLLAVTAGWKISLDTWSARTAAVVLIASTSVFAAYAVHENYRWLTHYRP